MRYLFLTVLLSISCAHVNSQPRPPLPNPISDCEIMCTYAFGAQTMSIDDDEACICGVMLPHEGIIKLYRMDKKPQKVKPQPPSFNPSTYDQSATGSL